MKKTPKISVIMSVYNNKKYLAEAIDSILMQTFKHFELVIIDDGSIDGASEILEKYALKDRRILLIKNKTNIGLIKSLNKALKIAKGEYIARMDGDDICFPSRFQIQVKYLNENPNISLVYSDTMLIDKNSQDVCRSRRPQSVKKVLLNLGRYNFIPHPTVMFRRSILSIVGEYNELCKNYEDRDLWIRMRDSGLSFGYINEVLLKYRLNPKSVNAKKDESYWFSVARTCLRHNSRRKGLSYLGLLTISEKIKIVLRSFIPNFIYNLRLK